MIRPTSHVPIKSVRTKGRLSAISTAATPDRERRLHPASEPFIRDLETPSTRVRGKPLFSTLAHRRKSIRETGKDSVFESCMQRACYIFTTSRDCDDQPA